MTTLEILKAARALIADPTCWTQGAAARNRHGLHVGALEPSAVCWCAAGAVFKAAGRFNTQDYDRAIDALGGWRVVCTNDEGTYDSVLAMFDEAIARAE